MDIVLGSWASSPLVQALLIGGIVFVSALVVGGISAALPFTVPLWVKSLATGVLVGAALFFLSGGVGGGVENIEGEETTTAIINEEINLSATEIILEHEIDREAKTFNFILGGKKLNMSNWEEELKEELKQYKNLKRLIVKDTGTIIYSHVVALEEIDKENEEIDIIFQRDKE